MEMLIVTTEYTFCHYMPIKARYSLKKIVAHGGFDLQQYGSIDSSQQIPISMAGRGW